MLKLSEIVRKPRGTAEVYVVDNDMTPTQFQRKAHAFATMANARISCKSSQADFGDESRQLVLVKVVKRGDKLTRNKSL